MDSEITICLPWPPSSNTYWRRNGNQYFITSKGIEYRKLTYYECIKLQKSRLYDKRLAVFIAAFPPDRKKRDLDNLFKCILDSLQYALVMEDDNQIDTLYIQRMPDLLSKVVIKIDEFK